jgi:hypothetical protein
MGVLDMKCPYCGENNLVNTKFCAECGKPLSGDLPSYMYKEEPTLWEKMNEMVSELKKAVTEKNYKEILSNKENPITNMLIVFAAWLILRVIGIIPFIILVRILALLMSIPGAIFLLAMTYVYSTHKQDIMDKVDELKGIDYKKSLKDIMHTIEKRKNSAFDDKQEIDEE